MRKIFALTVAVAFTLGLTGAALAQGATGTTGTMTGTATGQQPGVQTQPGTGPGSPKSP